MILTVCGLVMTGGIGCGDHRIPLRAFLEMEQERKAATTQPTPPPGATTQQSVNAAVDKALGPYLVGPGDVLSVTVSTGDQAEGAPPVQARVDRKGQVELPLVGKVSVAGKELEDVEDAIQKGYVPAFYQDAAVHVALVTPDVTEVLVVGAVTQPGLMQLRRTERDMLHAIVTAGGVSELASGEVTLKRIRRPGEEVTLNLTTPDELKAALALDPLADGDIIHVHTATPNTVFVGGLVNSPRPQSYPSGTDVTVLQAIAASGGLRTDLTPREGTLIRRMEDGEEVHVKLNLDRITQGKDPNIRLAAGDILWVPYTVETRVQEWVNRNLFLRAGVSANVNYNVTGVEFLNRRSLQTSRTGGGGGSLMDQFDPFGFLNRNAALQQLRTTP